MSENRDLSGSAQSWEALRGQIRMLLEQTGMGPSQFANKHQLNKSSVTRYCAGERLASWSFFELLLTEAETAAGAPLTDDLRQATLRCYRNVLDLGRHPELREILDLTQHVQTLTSELSRAHYEIHYLTSRLNRTAGTTKDVERTTSAAEIRLAELAVTQLTAQRDYCREEAATRAAALPAATRALYDADLPVPAREPTPPWWNTPSAAPAAALPGGRKPTVGRIASGLRKSATRWKVASSIGVVAAACAGYAMAGRSGPSPADLLTVSGELSCSSGAQVTGVWVEASTKEDSNWGTTTTTHGVTSYQGTLPRGESYLLHIGCGGTAKSWDPVTPTGRGVHTPWVSGTHNSFSCYDVQGKARFGECVIK